MRAFAGRRFGGGEARGRRKGVKVKGEMMSFYVLGWVGGRDGWGGREGGREGTRYCYHSCLPVPYGASGVMGCCLARWQLGN